MISSDDLVGKEGGMNKLIAIIALAFIGITPAYGETMTKAYTVAEIDALRHVVEMRFLWGSSVICLNSSRRNGFSRSYTEEEKTKAVEEMVRTYMLSGITAEQIIAEDKKQSSC